MATPHTHSVHAHLGVKASEYDADIRRKIPGYEEMLATTVRWLEGHVPAGGLIIDLGAGTGGLTRAILDALPTVRVRLVDIDPAMLAEAASRCSNQATRIELRKSLFAEGLGPCDAVVASLSLHHIADPAEKLELFRKVRASLRPGGGFVIADATAHPDGRERKRLFAEWSHGMQQHGISAMQAEGHFTQWATEDHYRPLVDELAALQAAGFPRADCFWKRGALTVYGGFV